MFPIKIFQNASALFIIILLWAYFLFGSTIFFILFYIPAYLFSENRARSFQNLNHIHMKNFFALTRLLIPRTKFKIQKEIRREISIPARTFSARSLGRLAAALRALCRALAGPVQSAQSQPVAAPRRADFRAVLGQAQPAAMAQGHLPRPLRLDRRRGATGVADA